MFSLETHPWWLVSLVAVGAGLLFGALLSVIFEVVPALKWDVAVRREDERIKRLDHEE